MSLWEECQKIPKDDYEDWILVTIMMRNFYFHMKLPSIIDVFRLAEASDGWVVYFKKNTPDKALIVV